MACERRLTLDAPIPMATVLVKRMDFRGRRVAEAMVREGRGERGRLVRWDGDNALPPSY